MFFKSTTPTFFSDEFNKREVEPHWKKSLYWCGPLFHPVTPHTGYYSPDNFTFTDSTIRLWTRYQPKTFWNDHTSDSVTIEYSLGLLDLIPWIEQEGHDLINDFYLECRAKMPEGKIEWPAFWLCGYQQWPPEVDIFEYWKGEEGEFSNNFHYNEGEQHKQTHKKYIIPADKKYDFHIYGLKVMDDSMEFYFDGFMYRKIKRVSNYLHKFTVIVNNGVHNDPDNDTYLEVDWVRIYKF